MHHINITPHTSYLISHCHLLRMARPLVSLNAVASSSGRSMCKGYFYPCQQGIPECRIFIVATSSASSGVGDVNKKFVRSSNFDDVLMTFRDVVVVIIVIFVSSLLSCNLVSLNNHPRLPQRSSRLLVPWLVPSQWTRRTGWE